MIAEADVKKLYSVEEYLEITSQKDGRYELVEGELVEMSGAYEEHIFVCGNMYGYLWQFVKKNKVGRVYGSDAKYETIPAPSGTKKGTVRQPDVSFVQTSRVTPKVHIFRYAPDLAVEVISPSNTFLEIENKTVEYRNRGGQLVWVIQLDQQLVHVYRAGSLIRQTLTADDELDGENVLPGFKLKVADLFV